MIEYIDFSHLPDDMQQYVAGEVAAFTSGEGYTKYKMLKQTPMDILAKMGVVALDISDENNPKYVGYQGANEPIDKDGTPMSEVGILNVKKEYWGQGIGKKLKAEMVEKLAADGIVPYSFCNDYSLPGALAVGFTLAEAHEVPPEALDLCTGCSMFEAAQNAGKLCCDTIVIYKVAAGGK